MTYVSIVYWRTVNVHHAMNAQARMWKRFTTPQPSHCLSASIGIAETVTRNGGTANEFTGRRPRGDEMWHTGNYGNELNITKAQAEIGSHSGACDGDIAYLRTLPAIRRQLKKLDPETLRKELKDNGAWDGTELANHDENVSRWLWIACGDIMERET